jgi:hypothetical protein
MWTLKLNDFGKAFKDAGPKFPRMMRPSSKSSTGDVGISGRKNCGSIPYAGTILTAARSGQRFNTFFRSSPEPNDFNLQSPRSDCLYPRTDWSGVQHLMAGSGMTSFWVDDDISVGGSGANGG